MALRKVEGKAFNLYPSSYKVGLYRGQNLLLTIYPYGDLDGG